MKRRNIDGPALSFSEEARALVEDRTFAIQTANQAFAFRSVGAFHCTRYARRKSADFHQGQKRKIQLLKPSEYMVATGFIDATQP